MAENAQRRNCRLQGTRGFTLIEIMIVVMIISMLLMIAIPNFQAARTQSHEKACRENLRVIFSAKEQWAMNNNQSAAAAPDWADLRPYLRNDSLTCPSGGSYSINNVNTYPTCSYGGKHAYP